ncbi:hypothetical protein [Pedobacter psychrodurus]|uniref:hypothetical protein n=1 Tax=Pedobacter psychrodurus TaxID=2530456 RepID=UPI00292ED944|nr:hypothetical protein [Pedobacter psychrodurus]
MAAICEADYLVAIDIYLMLAILAVKMRLGGISISGLASIIKQNKEILISCQGNGLFTITPLVYAKYLFKMVELYFLKN